MTLDELMHSKLYWAQIVLVVAALTLSFTTDWFLTLAIYACIGLVVCAVLACRWMWQDMELGDEHQPHHTSKPLRLTLRGRRLVLLLVLMLVSVVALTVSVQHHKTETQPVEHLYGFMQPTCWHPPMLADPALPPCQP